MAALRSALDAAGVELVLAGHDHDYERLLPTDPSGTLDTAHGVMSLVVGTGGVGEVTGFTPRPNSAVREAATFGVKKLTLRAHDFDWPFIPVAGKTFTDPGTASCHAAP
jgi:20S proteasome alpha/beta subunit